MSGRFGCALLQHWSDCATYHRGGYNIVHMRTMWVQIPEEMPLYPGRGQNRPAQRDTLWRQLPTRHRVHGHNKKRTTLGQQYEETLWPLLFSFCGRQWRWR